MTYSDICSALRGAGIDGFRREAALLLDAFCGVSAERLPLVRNVDFTSPELIRAVERRMTRYPLQYIIGSWSFCGETYSVGPGCLIPRPETEQLVTTAAELLPKNARFLDLCTGSGCIAVSLLARRTDCRGTAVDISPDALEYAERNAAENGVRNRLTLIEADILGNAAVDVTHRESFHAVISNPPYIPTDVLSGLEPELSFEPRAALDGGGDGLVFYRDIIGKYRDALEPGGFMLFELGAGEAEKVSRIAAEQGFSCTVSRDMSGIERTALLYIKEV